MKDEQDLRDIYMVYREGGDSPREEHDSFNGAMTEAQRLANLPISIKNGAVFHVMEAINMIKSPVPEVIEVGDVVKYGDATSQEWVVIWANRDVVNLLIQYKNNIPIEITKGQVTLIRKAPETITFEGVSFDSEGMPWKSVGSGCPLELHGPGSQFGKLKGNGATYKMILEKEVS